MKDIPLDPFTGKNLVYRKQQKQFILYSLGTNMKDDGGKWDKKNRWNGDIVWEE